MTRVLIGVCVALALLSALLWRGRDNAIAELAKQRVAYEKALGEAELLAAKARIDAEAHYRSLANETDDRAARTVADARNAADRYIDRMRAKGCAGPTSATVAASSGDSAPSADGPGFDSVMVLADDVRTCSVNTQRLIEAREWALGLNQ